ncbi:MAG: NADP oxidoreductase [Candidatus Margulisbacteria bacterium]|nr:NADP oxidoreductase [Candidatus Margulisiibacteriota bacterium]
MTLRVAIIGAGPSGMYAADALFKLGISVEVDAFDRLPTPYGLLRGGVAPDHQKMKSVAKYYDRVASHPNFSFFGNVKIGRDLSVEELRSYYDACIFTCGAETDKKLGITGEDLPGSFAATEFVGWYNGHPDFQNRVFDLSQERVAIIGQGNVAIDVTRILAKTPQELASSDISAAAMDLLLKSKVKDIYLIGRRGPIQAAFTKMEIEELGHLEDCDVVVQPKDLENCDPGDNHKAQKNLEVLRALSVKPREGKSKCIHVYFYRSPLEIQGDASVKNIVLGINRLENSNAVLTDEREDLNVGLVFRSVGYYGVPIPGVIFDEKKGVIPNVIGRVEPGLYVSGWIKRGPSGVLGSNKPDSTETVQSLLSDIPILTHCKNRSTDSLIKLLKSRHVTVVTFSDWQRLDAEEQRRGQEAGKPREKFTSITDMLSFLHGEN